MAARAVSVFLLLLGLSGGTGPGPGPDSERGRMQLRRVQGLATQPRYGECWSRALEHLDTRCRDLTSESQSRIALSFTYCHLSSSGRDFPACPKGSEVSRCTGAMDAVAFNTYTEFFTHTHSICHFLQSETWQSRAENTMYRLTESSAGVAEQLQSTRQMAEELIEAQSEALQAQQAILNSGEELKVTLQDSTQGLRAVFSELSSVSRDQQVVLSELFNRVSFLHSFLLMEAHSLSSCCYNAAALFTSFFLTSTQRSSRASAVFMFPVLCLQELLSVYVSVLRRVMVCVGVCVLLVVCVRYRDPVQQSLQVLRQLTETQRSLQEALQRAGDVHTLVTVNNNNQYFIDPLGRTAVRQNMSALLQGFSVWSKDTSASNQESNHLPGVRRRLLYHPSYCRPHWSWSWSNRIQSRGWTPQTLRPSYDHVPTPGNWIQSDVLLIPYLSVCREFRTREEEEGGEEEEEEGAK
uniref:Uncharacterized protein n=1 Tax=Anabas testudineus TaxID=64144 RepID=A0A3Q1JAV6_ANATE